MIDVTVSVYSLDSINVNILGGDAEKFQSMVSLVSNWSCWFSSGWKKKVGIGLKPPAF